MPGLITSSSVRRLFYFFSLPLFARVLAMKSLLDALRRAELEDQVQDNHHFDEALKQLEPFVGTVCFRRVPQPRPGFPLGPATHSLMSLRFVPILIADRESAGPSR